MPKLLPLDWRILAKIFEAEGFQFVRQKGSHRAYVKPGLPRAVVIPEHSEVTVGVIKGNMRTAGMSRERFFELMGKVR